MSFSIKIIGRHFTTFALSAAALFLLLLSGCTTTDSDIPWNTPQSWEGAPGLPGLSGGQID